MATRKIRLTKRSVEALKPQAGGSYIRWDSDCRSFGCRVLSSGTKTYIFQPHGRGALRIGRADAITPDQARDAARRMLAKHDLGEALPSRRNKPAKAAEGESAPQTLGELWERYAATKLLLRRPETQTTYRSIWRCHLESMAGKKLPDFSEGLVEDLHGEITRERVSNGKSVRGGPVAANSACTLLRTLLGMAERRNWIAVNPARRFTKNKVEPVQNDMTEAELARVVEILQNSGKPVDLCLLFMIATGARRGETLAMCWRDLDMTAGTWIKARRTTKGGRTQRLSLSDEALELLRALPRGLPGATVFGLNHWGNAVDRRWGAVRRAVGIPNVRPHDLRHAYAMACVRQGVHLTVIRDLLGHASVSQTERYARADDEQQRAAVKKVGAVLGNVLAFKKTA
jgi:integrase